MPCNPPLQALHARPVSIPRPYIPALSFPRCLLSLLPKILLHPNLPRGSSCRYHHRVTRWKYQECLSPARVSRNPRPLLQITDISMLQRGHQYFQPLVLPASTKDAQGILPWKTTWTPVVPRISGMTRSHLLVFRPCRPTILKWIGPCMSGFDIESMQVDSQ